MKKIIIIDQNPYSLKALEHALEVSGCKPFIFSDLEGIDYHIKDTEAELVIMDCETFKDQNKEDLGKLDLKVPAITISKDILPEDENTFLSEKFIVQEDIKRPIDIHNLIDLVKK